MFAEEQFLRKKFGEKYINWSKRTPAFIPNFKNYTKSNLPFSWKKVMKKEKNGFFALFLVFAVFNISGEIIEKDTDYNYFVIIVCILTMIMYIVLKCLKKYTNMLNEDNR
jgi:protein-S-isoprenylcysteine O-methyltransferase Ste14